ncbi:DNA/RNA non-specific endonuclease, partial [Leptolyngbyaceae cyanobacterium UHCC 1019]
PMTLRSHTSKKTAPDSATPVQNPLQPRPFATSIPTEAPGTQPQEFPDIQTQLENARRFGHHIDKIFPTSSDSPSGGSCPMIQPKLSIDAVGQTTAQPGNPLLMRQPSPEPDGENQAEMTEPLSPGLPDHLAPDHLAGEETSESQPDLTGAEEVKLSNIDITFEMDADGDGEEEQKRLFFKGEGENAELMLNPDPIPFGKFLAKQKYNNIARNNQVLQTVALIQQEVKKAITQTRGQLLARTLTALAQILSATFRVSKPPSSLRWHTRQIVDPISHTSETVTDTLVAQPLSSIPDPGIAGSKPQQSTPFMKALRKWAPYIRGHMLNDKLHGPGEDKNLVPISATFNSTMKNSIEQYLKDKVLSKNGVVSYSIEPTQWGQYRGTTNKPLNIQNLLPAGFIVKIDVMQLRHPGDDGTIAANWIVNPNKQILNKTFNHDIPNTTTFNYDSAPQELSAGYGEILGSAYPNPDHADWYVVQGTLRWCNYVGKETIKEYPDPVNLAASQKNGKATLEQIDDDYLMVKCNALALKQVQNHLNTQLRTKLDNLNARMEETKNLVNGSVQSNLSKCKQTLDQFLAANEQRINQNQRKDTFQIERHQNYPQKYSPTLTKAEQTAIEILQRHQQREVKFKALVGSSTQFWQVQENLAKNVATTSKFWQAQDQRETQFAQEEAMLDEITLGITKSHGNREDFQTLNRLEQELKSMISRINGDEAFEKERHAQIQRELLNQQSRTLSSQPPRSQNQSTDLSNIHQQIHLDIDLSDIDLSKILGDQNSSMLPISLNSDDTLPSSMDLGLTETEPKSKNTKPLGRKPKPRSPGSTDNPQKTKLLKYLKERTIHEKKEQGISEADKGSFYREVRNYEKKLERLIDDMGNMTSQQEKQIAEEIKSKIKRIAQQYR